jgi:hypothetical protein
VTVYKPLWVTHGETEQLFTFHISYEFPTFPNIFYKILQKFHRGVFT